MQTKFENATVYFSEYVPSATRLAEVLSLLPQEKEYAVFPGFCDVHVHFREPGFSYKETIRSGTLAAAHGGYTAVCTMPNLMPVPDNSENLAVQEEIIKSDACIGVFPYGSITVGQKGERLSDMGAIASRVVAFSDDGKGVARDELSELAMQKAHALGKIIVMHCEDERLVNGGYIHDGAYAREYGHKGISSESEWKPLARDIELLRKTGAAYHVCHVSTKESVELIRAAKKEGLSITAETAPHYLVLEETNLEEDGRFKMNPPVRRQEDRLALIEGIKDGTIDMIATDHAPHSAEEKSKGLAGSAFGIVGLETAFSVLYTDLVKTGTLTLTELVRLLAVRPRERFGIPFEGFTVWDLEKESVIDPDTFLSKGRATPFRGKKVNGECVCTVYQNKPVWRTKK